ncbi:uncharacterized protein LOC127253286 isoform X2 [Andrographis paniculata]|nr:uncharacterized protein LOC127253286 isoform X2 [Andrographis paniculata]
MDAKISIINTFEAKEAGPLILAWAVFLCLISSLPEKEDNNILMEIDHIGYVRQAFEVLSLEYFHAILQSDILKHSDGPVAGYRSVLRTFMSAFIASYEINLQFEDANLKLILDILCKIYRGEEALCIQFWDRDSFIDGPVRCLLGNLEGEFPFRTIELISLLSALCEGSWPSECVFNFLDKSVGLSTLLEIGNGSVVDPVSNIVETQFPLRVAGIEGLTIPAQSRGRVLRMIDEKCVLVRWECTESGVLVLLLHLAQDLHRQNTEELIIILDLFSRLVTFNTGVHYSLMDFGNFSPDEAISRGNLESYVRIHVIEIVCALLKSLSPSLNGVLMMSMGINILTKMMRCLPSHVALMAMKGNIFDVALTENPFGAGSNNLSSGSWLLSGRLAKMLLIDCEQSDCLMTLSVLDFTMNLLDTGLESDAVLALIVFSLQYVLVNHEYWKYKVKSARWKVTVKVLEVVKKCTRLISHSKRVGESIRDIMLSDSSIHSAIFRIVCTTAPSLEKLYVSRTFDMLDIEGLQLAISSGLDVLVSMLDACSKDSSGLPVFHQAILSSRTKPIPVLTAAISLMTYFRNAEIQMGATRLLSMLFAAYSFEGYNVCLGLEDKQVVTFQKTVCNIFNKQSPWTENLLLSTWKHLVSAAQNQPAFLNAVMMSKEYLSGQVLESNSEHQQSKFENGLMDSGDDSLLDEILQCLKDSEDIVHSKPDVYLFFLNFLRALWQGAPQFTKMLELLKISDKFWRQITIPVVLVAGTEGKLSENLTEKELQNTAYKYRFLSYVLDILGCEVFLQKKLMHAELVANKATKSLTNETEKRDSKLSKSESLSNLKEIISTWCKSSVLSDLIRACVSWEFDNSFLLRSRIAGALFAVSAMVKLRHGDCGSLSISLVERIVMLSQKLCKLPAFSELSTQYKARGYSEGPQVENLILSDLYYLIQGELEGRLIENKPFKELLQFMVESTFLTGYENRRDDNILADVNSIFLYDNVRLRADLGLELWELSRWKESKEAAESMLLYLQDANTKMLCSNAKLSALRGLVTLLHMREHSSTDAEALTGLKISDGVVSSCIDHVCQCLHNTIKLLAPVPNADEHLLNILTAQAELLLILVRSSSNNSSQTARVLIVKTCGYGLKVLCSCSPSLDTGTATKLLLMLIHSLIELSSPDLNAGAGSGGNPDEYSLEASNSTLGLLPVLCSCIQHPDYCTLSLAAIDSILKGFSMPDSWFPVLQKHMPLQHVVQKLQDISLSGTVVVILKFLLNLARIRQGAEMLLNASILASLKVLLSDFSEAESLSVIQCEKILSPSEKTDNPQPIWGLGIAVLTAIIQSLGDSAASTSVVDYVMTCILVEKAPLVSYYLSAPDFPNKGHENKRAHSLKSNVSLSELKETQYTLTLICVLARHCNSWKKILRGMDSPLREKCIHFLAFISRGTQHLGESPKGVAPPLLCYPVLKEEFELYKKPSFINSRNGWFALSALSCTLNPKFAPLSSRTALAVRDQSNDNADVATHSHLSDVIAIDIYRIVFLLLKFLCLQAESAARKAEEVGFVDLVHFPELPMPEILHGLQDQGIAITTEVCEANKSKQLAPELQEVCLLLLQITVMALYLELCVIQICGIRPVLGHVETFSRELRLLIRATDGHVFLKEPLKTLNRIVSFVYPELVQQEALF